MINANLISWWGEIAVASGKSVPTEAAAEKLFAVLIVAEVNVDDVNDDDDDDDDDVADLDELKELNPLCFSVGGADDGNAVAG